MNMQKTRFMIEGGATVHHKPGLGLYQNGDRRPGRPVQRHLQKGLRFARLPARDHGAAGMQTR